MIAAAAWGIAIAVLVAWPPTSSLDHADAIVVLSGDHGERLSRAVVLLRRGVAPALVFVGEPDTVESSQFCRGGQPFQVFCLRPNSDNTAAEARAVTRLSATRHWSRVVVVTTNDHVLRTWIQFRRCFRGNLGVQGAPLPLGRSVELRLMVHEWLGTVHATIVHGRC